MNNINKIGLGTVQFGLPYGISNRAGQTSPSQVTQILKIAGKNGIEILDSASAYGNAEEVLGKNSLVGFKIVSKYLPPATGTSVSLQLNNSLQNLNISRLYGYLAHRPLEILNSPEEWKELQDLKENGKVEKIGFSLNEPDELDALLDRNYIPDLIQVPYNYFDRRFEKGILKLKDGGCEIHTRSAFLQGLFFINSEDLSSYYTEVKPLLSILQENKEALPGKLLKFVIDKPFIDKVIIGVENEVQLTQNLHDIKEADVLPAMNQSITNNILIPSRWPKE